MSKFQRVINNKRVPPHHFSGEKFNQAKTIKSGAGFTLVEMLVAMAIFVIVVAIISGLFVHAIQGQRRNLAYQELLDQTSYVMERMSRSIRMAMKDDIEIWGYPVPPPPNCIPDIAPYERGMNYGIVGNCLVFRNYKNECQQFCRVDDGGRFKLVEIIDGTSADLTSTSSLNVGLLLPHPWIELTGEGQGDDIQPLVNIRLQIDGREQTRIQIQTSISQRNLDTVRTLP